MWSVFEMKWNQLNLIILQTPRLLNITLWKPTGIVIIRLMISLLSWSIKAAFIVLLTVSEINTMLHIADNECISVKWQPDFIQKIPQKNTLLIRTRFSPHELAFTSSISLCLQNLKAFFDVTNFKWLCSKHLRLCINWPYSHSISISFCFLTTKKYAD